MAVGEGNPLAVASGVARFEAALPDRVGVGDVLLYSTDGTAAVAGVALVAERRSPTELRVQAPDGGMPEDTAGTDARWSLFRAHSSLADAVTGVPNPGLPAALAPRVATTEPADLVAANAVWNIACYADGPDSLDRGATVVVWDTKWITGPANYLRIFAPSLPTEVGASQRHAGAWDPSRYQLVKTADGAAHLIDLFAGFVRVESLQIAALASNSADAAINVGVRSGGDVRVSSVIVRGDPANAAPSVGIMIGGQAAGVVRLWNDVIWGMSGACIFDNTAAGTGATAYVYNATLFGCRTGIDDRYIPLLAKNLLLAGIPSDGRCVADLGAFAVASDHNLCNLEEPQRGPASKAGAVVGFANASAGDFHLTSGEDAALGTGADLSSDPELSFDVDFEGEPRRPPWDVGADQHQGL